MLCPKCHTRNRDNARFCKSCGLSFTPEMLAAAQAAETAPQILQGQNMPSQDNQEYAASVTTAPHEDTMSTEMQQAPANGTKVGVEDDIALAPTQILTPQQMIAYHAKRWQQELEREQQAKQGQEPMD